MREKLTRFMVGRNGNDQLNLFLYAVDAVLLIAATLIGGQVGRWMFAAVLVLLGYIGGKMIWEDLRREEDAPGKRVTPAGLLVQALATSIDALSVGFTTQHYDFPQAAVSSLIIGVVTLALCAVGVRLGKTVGNRFRHAELVGGIILIGIGIEIFVKDVFF